MPEIPNEVLILRALYALERAILELNDGRLADGVHSVERGIALLREIR